ncbi:Uncharacterised protein [Blautia hydrogenotrophica]|nr:Uncharacterised protein [Blautia hydrogenotrophica]SCI01959.1 Uncharacterised protein [uncultured Blautia sp.]
MMAEEENPDLREKVWVLCVPKVLMGCGGLGVLLFLRNV